MSDRASVIAWVADEVDRFFLEIQGSGKIYLDNGRVLNAHYHRSNGRPYRSIGALLIKQGKIPKAEMSMQAIRSYLKSHPKEVRDRCRVQVMVWNYFKSFNLVVGVVGFEPTTLAPQRPGSTTELHPEQPRATLQLPLRVEKPRAQR